MGKQQFALDLLLAGISLTCPAPFDQCHKSRQAMLKDSTDIQQNSSSNFYITGGTLRGDAACYVHRQADQSLFDNLKQGQFCYVLTSRQMGKSSLMVRTAARLREAGVGVAVLDLTAIGQNLTAEQWYDGLLSRIGRQLQLEDELEEFWFNHPRLGPLQRWMSAIDEVVLPRYPGRLVIFIDEIDTVRSLPFSTDEFFAGIREFYNRRTSESDLERLTFCLLGVASPSDLIRDTRMTPFNIGQRIELRDFTEGEARPLAEGLGGNERSETELISRVLYWTGGHPYLTQRLCRAIAEDKVVTDGKGVDHKCEELFFNRRAQDGDDNLIFVRERLLRSEVEVAGLLTLYDKVHSGKRVADDETNSLVTALHLSGITRHHDGYLKVRNRIYERVFDRDWIKEHMPDAELRRQRMAYRRGIIRTSAIAAVIVAVITTLAIIAYQQRNLAQTREETNRRQLYAAQMNLAMRAWEDAGIPIMEDLLNNQIPKPGQKDLRGFEWSYLWGLANSDLWTVKQGNSNGSMVFLRDNKRLAIGSDDNLIVIWDIASGKKIMTLKGHSSGIQSIAVSPDGHYLASASADKTAKIWDLGSGNELVTLKGHQNLIVSIRFSPDGSRIATASFDGKAILWDVKTGRKLLILQHPAEVTCLDFSPDGKMLATGCFDWIARIWNLSTGSIDKVLKGHSAYVTSLRYSPDGKTLVTGGGDLSARFWDPVRGTPILNNGSEANNNSSQKQISGSHVISIAYSPDGKLLAIAGYDRKARIYSTDNLALVNTYKGHGMSVDAVEFSGNSKLLATYGRDGFAKIWDLSESQEKILKDGEYNVDSNFKLAFSKDERYLFTGGRSDVHLWDTKTQQLVRSFKGNKDVVWGIAVSHDGKMLASASQDKTIKIWDVSTGQELKTLFGHESFVNGVIFSPDDRSIASCSLDGTAKIWDVNTGREIHSFNNNQGLNVYSIVFSPDGHELATANDDGTIRVWDTVTKKQLLLLSCSNSIYAIRYSDDGKKLAYGGMNGIGVLYDLETQKEIVTFKGHVGEITHICFFPDGKRIATGGGDGFVKIWSIETGQELLSIKHDTNILGMAISNNGRVLASSEGKFIYLRQAVDPAESMKLKKVRLAKLIDGIQ
ncbi:MAG: AAA-like domain-containing protein [Blastocatellales bacterium]